MQDSISKGTSNIVPHQGKKPGNEGRVIYAVAVFCLALCAGVARGQAAPPGTTAPPVVDSAPASPISPPANQPVVESATEASPSAAVAHGVYLPAHTEVDVKLGRMIDSAHVHNGDMLDATLAAAVRASDGRMLTPGTRVGVTVVAVAPAGKLQSRGELTLQVTHVGPVAVLSDELTFFGKEGHKELPDSAPEKGTEASLAPDTALRFHVPVVSQ